MSNHIIDFNNFKIKDHPEANVKQKRSGQRHQFLLSLHHLFALASVRASVSTGVSVWSSHSRGDKHYGIPAGYTSECYNTDSIS